jgi:hypothetical protein
MLTEDLAITLIRTNSWLVSRQLCISGCCSVRKKREVLGSELIMLNIMNNWFILFDTAELLSEETETITIH